MLIKMPYIRVGKPLPYICNKIRLRGVEYIYLATFGPLGPTPYTHYVPLSRVFIRLKWSSKCVLSGAVQWVRPVDIVTYIVESYGGRGMISNHRTGPRGTDTSRGHWPVLTVDTGQAGTEVAQGHWLTADSTRGH